jgi:hypothetical protein
MTVTIGRRELLAALGGAAAAWPLGARGQQQALPVVGFLNTRVPGADPHLLAAFRRGLKETGYVEGQNVTRSNTAGHITSTIDCQHWRPIWSAIRCP